jgi:hypothetical protein
MLIDTDRLAQLAGELKSLDQQREKLLAELHRIAGGSGGGASVAPRRGRPPRSLLPTMAPSRAELAVPRRNGGRKKGLTTAIVDLLQGNGAAYTAGDIVKDLRLPKTKSQIASVSTTLVRLAKEGRLKKDEERGYVAA